MFGIFIPTIPLQRLNASVFLDQISRQIGVFSSASHSAKAGAQAASGDADIWQADTAVDQRCNQLGPVIGFAEEAGDSQSTCPGTILFALTGADHDDWHVCARDVANEDG